jgi:hypothetical protein
VTHRDSPHWHDEPPARPGVYPWRRKRLWEPVERTIDATGLIYSHRFCKLVPVAQLVGQWYYEKAR